MIVDSVIEFAGVVSPTKVGGGDDGRSREGAACCSLYFPITIQYPVSNQGHSSSSSSSRLIFCLIVFRNYEERISEMTVERETEHAAHRDKVRHLKHALGESQVTSHP